MDSTQVDLGLTTLSQPWISQINQNQPKTTWGVGAVSRGTFDFLFMTNRVSYAIDYIC